VYLPYVVANRVAELGLKLEGINVFALGLIPLLGLVLITST
jgi:hypothetical protein